MSAAAPELVALPRLAVVIPLKDELPGLPALAQRLQELRPRFAKQVSCEWVLVDDGSTDGTSALLQQLFAGSADVRLVAHPRNLGIAAALRSGFLASDAPLLASIDSDLSYDPLELLAMLPLLEGAEVVTASPYHPRGGTANVPRWRLLLSRSLSRCYRMLLRADLHTWTSCCRLYRRSAVVALPQQEPGFLGIAELLIRVLRRGGVVREHPCVLATRRFGASKMKTLRTIGGHLRLLWQTARGSIH